MNQLHELMDEIETKLADLELAIRRTWAASDPLPLQEMQDLRDQASFTMKQLRRWGELLKGSEPPAKGDSNAAIAKRDIESMINPKPVSTSEMNRL
jgi:hypothetical protein